MSKPTPHSTPRLLLAALGLLLAATAHAYPPAPHHEVYGMLRDSFGTPFDSGNARVFLEDGNGIVHEGVVSRGMGDGTNYSIIIPMDSGRTPDLYKPSAMRQFTPFTIRVLSGGRNHVPMEIVGSTLQLGAPAARTRLDITLGVDSDGDGLPDEWERTLIAMLGGNLTLADIRPEDDSDGDGMTNLQEYLAGTYPWDYEDRLALDILEVRNGRAVLEFMVIDGREYIVHGSTDLKNWAPVNFRIPDRDAPDVSRSRFIAPVFEPRIEIEAAPPATPGRQFFRLQAR
jgi:hypothetical protein